jgi:glycosyltransferase involved in cell wall biosynthesis
VKIALIAHGELPVPPQGHGAVEQAVWCWKQYLERAGHSVDIANTRAIHKVILDVNRRAYDFVHCHSELFVLECVAHVTRPLAVTSHHGALHQFDPDVPDRYPAFHYLFADTLRAPANIVLCERVREIYQRAGYRHLLRVLPNAVETDRFRWAPQGNGRAVCVGRICQRKRQRWLAEIACQGIAVDFVGPWNRRSEAGFAEHEHARYLGEWDKATLYDRLTDYSCLVLLSESEGAPKVVLEALAAGLSVVIGEPCTANLTNEAFITVIPDGETRPDVIAHAIQTAIDRNGAQRDAIRAYAKQRFDYEALLPRYLGIIEEVRDYSGQGD